MPAEVPNLFVGLDPEIDKLANPKEFLMEINNWVPSNVVIRMFDNARAISQDDDIAFKIGFDSASRKKLGYIQRIILLAYKNPRRSLRRAQKINDKFNRNKRIEIVETTRDRAVIRLHWFDDIPSIEDFCRFNKGIYTGIPTIWNLPPAILDETKCYFKGDEYCEYHLKWIKRFSLKESLLNLLVPWRALRYTIEELERDKELLKRKFEEVHYLNIQLKERLDELMSLQEALKESEAKFRNLLEYLPGVAVQGYGVDGTVRYWNKASEKLYGYLAEEAVGRNLADLIIPPEIKPLFAKGLELGALATKSGEFMPPGEVMLLQKNGSRVPVHSIHTVVRLEGMEPLLFCIDVDLSERKRVEEELRRYRDHLENLVEERTGELTRVNQQLQSEIMERRRTELALRESEVRFRTIFEGAPIGIGLWSVEGKFLEGNPALTKMLGYGLEELRALDPARLSPPEDLVVREALFEEILKGRRDFFEREGRCRRKDGSFIWVWVHVSPIRDSSGKILFALVMFKDITQEKQVQAEISAYQQRLRSLASELSLTEERERRRLAADLHDHIGQILALAQIRLGELSQETASGRSLNTVGEIREYIGQAIRYTRSLTFELGLPVLYDLGLEAAVEWLADQFQEQHALVVNVNHDDQPKPLGEAASLLIFRVIRELLTNVVKHSHATQVEITMTREGDYLNLQVKDNGIGFDTSEFGARSGRAGGYGLFSIRERLNHLGGYLEVASQAGQGTKATITVPLEQDGRLASIKH
ncbi:MAG: PAS domain S-box protein [Deltaproteobacteria bacterium]|nr:PAS domain S-box protein [Deltaproteobacteria bacterium]